MDNFNISIPKLEFDFQIGESPLRMDNRYCKPRQLKNLKPRQLKFSNARDLAKQTVIGNSEKINVLVSGNFVFGDFIEAYFREHNIQTDRMVLTTLSMNKYNVDSLKSLMVGKYVKNLDVIVSSFFAHEKDNLIKYIYETLDFDDRFQLAVVRSHTKTVLFKTLGGKYIVINGSANLRSSNNIETFTIEECKETYDFHLEYSERILDKYKTINRTLGAKALWETITE